MNHDLHTDQEFHSTLCNGIILTSIPTFLYLTFFAAPYGKHIPTSSSSRRQQPKHNLFTGFYNRILQYRGNANLSWTVFESPNLVWSFYFIFRNKYKWDYYKSNNTIEEDGNNMFNFFLLCLFIFHYINRGIIYPLRMSSNSQPVPVLISFCAFAFTSVNGYIQAKGLCEIQTFPNNHHHNPLFLVGVPLFCIGFTINNQSDQILRHLRKSGTTTIPATTNTAGGEGGGRYKIPHGGLYEYVSAPNYFGEIVEWMGFAMACGFSQSAVSFLVYTCSNLIPRAVSNHEWYLTKFKEDYPRDRKALIPFVW